MNSAGCLLAAGGVLTVAAPAMLRRTLTGSWRAPRIGVAAWLLCSVSVVCSWITAAVIAGHGVLFGPAIAGAIIGRMAWSAVFVAVGERRRRLSHAEAVRLVGRYDAKLGITVLDSDVPAVYCLPGRPHTIVVTSSARALLRPRQLAAALAHERAHLRGYHHLALIAARVFTRAFGVVPLFRTAEQEIALLLEVAADDAAARGHGRRTLARALLTLAGGRSMIPSVGMPAGGSGVVSRVDRLLNPPRSSGIAGFLRGVAPLAVNVTASFALTGLPAAALAFHFGACSPHFS